MPSIYPFTAIVGQERMRRALILNAVDPRIGGVLNPRRARHAKSTAARALAALLPKVRTRTRLPGSTATPISRLPGARNARERAASGEPLRRG